MDGIPWSIPSNAPATVPELVTSSPRFHPLLIPETTSAGTVVSRRLQTANVTQSAGVPFTAYHRGRICRRRNGLCSVIARPTAFWVFSGATTHTSPNVAIALAKARRPGASMPSSLVTRIRLDCAEGILYLDFADDTEKPAPISLGRACQFTQLADN
jgi:hypothetical protein